MINKKMEKLKAGIYIHIPFCTVKCGYCDYYSVADRNNDIPTFIQSLLTEIEIIGNKFNHNWIFDTIFIGGGTPSLISPKWIEQIMVALDTKLNISNNNEITMEINPGDSTLDSLLEYKNIGVNRISIGFQSFDPSLLKLLDRIHLPKDNISTYDNARIVGYENINIDLIFNIPDQSISRWKKDIQSSIELKSEHITLYSLTLEEGTPMQSQVEKGNIEFLRDGTDVSMYEWAVKYISNQGYNHYELSSFAQPKKECKHNLHYWKREPYIGFGPSAHQYDGKTRSWNVKSLTTYVQQLSKNLLPIENEESLTKNDYFNELLFNGLRLREGIDIKELEKKYPGNDFNYYIKIYLKKWSVLKMISGVLHLNSNDIILADTIASDMFYQ